MIHHTLSRRTMMIGGTALLTLPPLSARAQGQPAALHVVKDPDCGCCTAWIEIAAAAGFDLTTQDMASADLARYKSDRGIPPEMVSCHTGEIGAYVIEGHVPPADIRRLLSERPEAVGLAVPGMSLPLLVDKEIDFMTAMLLSFEAVRLNLGIMVLWAIIIAAFVIAAMIPVYLGLFAALPILGHATWHFYRRLVV